MAQSRKRTLSRAESERMSRQLRKNGFSSYRAYLLSDLWRRNRKRLIGRRCERCGKRKRLQLHHKTYASLGCELARHVETLCDDCHRSEHGLPRRRRRKSG